MAEVEQVAEKALNTEPEKVRVKKVLIAFEGAQYSVDKDAVNDLDVMEYLAEIQSDPEQNAPMMILIFRKIIGMEQWEKFKETQRSDSERDTGDNLEAFINKIFKAVGDEK